MKQFFLILTSLSFVLFASSQSKEMGEKGCFVLLRGVAEESLSKEFKTLIELKQSGLLNINDFSPRALEALKVIEQAVVNGKPLQILTIYSDYDALPEEVQIEGLMSGHNEMLFLKVRNTAPNAKSRIIPFPDLRILSHSPGKLPDNSSKTLEKIPLDQRFNARETYSYNQELRRVIGVMKTAFQSQQYVRIPVGETIDPPIFYTAKIGWVHTNPAGGTYVYLTNLNGGNTSMALSLFRMNGVELVNSTNSLKPESLRENSYFQSFESNTQYQHSLGDFERGQIQRQHVGTFDDLVRLERVIQEGKPIEFLSPEGTHRAWVKRVLIDRDSFPVVELQTQDGYLSYSTLSGLKGFKTLEKTDSLLGNAKDKILPLKKSEGRRHFLGDPMRDLLSASLREGNYLQWMDLNGTEQWGRVREIIMDSAGRLLFRFSGNVLDPIKTGSGLSGKASSIGVLAATELKNDGNTKVVNFVKALSQQVGWNNPPIEARDIRTSLQPNFRVHPSTPLSPTLAILQEAVDRVLPIEFDVEISDRKTEKRRGYVGRVDFDVVLFFPEGKDSLPELYNTSFEMENLKLGTVP